MLKQLKKSLKKKDIMKNKIKVWLQYPWNVSDSQYYKSLVDNHPDNVEYINSIKKQGMITNKKTFFILTYLKQKAREIIELSRWPILNSKLTKTEEEYDLIHCAHCLSLNEDKPWVADFESAWQMWISGRDTQIGKNRALNLLKRKNCKKIVFWTDYPRDEFLKIFPEMKNKTTILGYGQKIIKFKKIKHKGINLLFVARFFDAKGGLEALDVFDYLTKKYQNINATIISKIPKDIVCKYEKNNKIKIYPDLLPYEELINSIFPMADILVYPGYSDTFGFIFTEAMSFGIPIVTVDGHAREDLVKEGKEGFIVKRPEIKMHENFPEIFERDKHINEIINKTLILIKNKKLRTKMAKNCMKTIKNGRFSIEKRNKKLRKIYEEALK